MTDTTTLTTVTMTPFAGHVRTLIWGSCAVARPSLMHIPKIVPGGDTACEPVVTCPCCGVEPCGVNADCRMCRDDAAALGVATTTAGHGQAVFRSATYVNREWKEYGYYCDWQAARGA